MASAFKTPQRTQGWGRGLLPFWQSELEKKLQINWYLLGHSKGATLEIVADMDRQSGHRPGTVYYPMTCNNSDQDNGDTESIRTRYCQLGPHLEATPQCVPKTWPKCLGMGAPLKSDS